MNRLLLCLQLLFPAPLSTSYVVVGEEIREQGGTLYLVQRVLTQGGPGGGEVVSAFQCGQDVSACCFGSVDNGRGDIFWNISSAPCRRNPNCPVTTVHLRNGDVFLLDTPQTGVVAVPDLAQDNVIAPGVHLFPIYVYDLSTSVIGGGLGPPSFFSFFSLFCQVNVTTLNSAGIATLYGSGTTIGYPAFMFGSSQVAIDASNCAPGATVVIRTSDYFSGLDAWSVSFKP